MCHDRCYACQSILPMLLLDTTYAVARHAGGLEGHPEGTRPSKTLFPPPDCAAGYPLGAAQSGGEISISGRQASPNPTTA
jgi:hypothetical protein